MNDRYLYRAKRKKDGKWTTWNAVTGIHGLERIKDDTICQCTGLKDKNGKLIWENDIIKCKGIITAVSWNTKYASWVLTRKGWMYHHFFGESQDTEECEVIGNIFDNPELLEVGE